MKNKILIIAIGLIVLICCCSFVSADSADDIGKIISSDFSGAQSYSGAGNSFTIDSDGSISPNGNSVLDLDYDFTIDIDESSVPDDVKTKLDDSNDLTCNFTISDGSSFYTFENVDCDVVLEDGVLTVNGSDMEYGLSGISVDLNDCEIVNCTLVSNQNGQITTFEAEK